MIDNKNPECVFLNPGEIAFGEAPLTIATLLGSCVSATLWHPEKKIGGMCHILLPEKPGSEHDTKVASGAVYYFIRAMRKYNTIAPDYEVRLYGGGNMFPHIKRSAKMDVGNRNILMMRQILMQTGFRLRKGLDEVGGNDYRRLTLDVSTGKVILKSTTVMQNENLMKGINNV